MKKYEKKYEMFGSEKTRKRYEKNILKIKKLKFDHHIVFILFIWISFVFHKLHQLSEKI